MELAIHLLHCHFLSHLESTRYDEIIDFFFLIYIIIIYGSEQRDPIK